MITISGHSDDIVSISGIASGADEVDAHERGVNFVVGSVEAKDGQDAFGVRIKMRYVAGGLWAATILPIEEGVKCPWPISISIEKYTVIVNIDCPKETPVSWRRVKGKTR